MLTSFVGAPSVMIMMKVLQQATCLATLAQTGLALVKKKGSLPQAFVIYSAGQVSPVAR